MLPKIVETIALLTPPLRQAQAYLDPGSGSILIQLLIASLLGAALVLRNSWGRIISFFKRVFSKSEPAPDDGDDQE